MRCEPGTATVCVAVVGFMQERRLGGRLAAPAAGLVVALVVSLVAGAAARLVKGVPSCVAERLVPAPADRPLRRAEVG
jgi:hypothetical protein